MAKLDKDKTFFIARDLDRPESQPGSLVAIYWEEWDRNRPVVEGWRGPRMDSEDYARKRLEPNECQNLMTDIGGFWECFGGITII